MLQQNIAIFFNISPDSNSRLVVDEDGKFGKFGLESVDSVVLLGAVITFITMNYPMINDKYCHYIQPVNSSDSVLFFTQVKVNNTVLTGWLILLSLYLVWRWRGCGWRHYILWLRGGGGGGLADAVVKVGGQCHLIITILRRFSWPNSAHMCKNVA